MGSLLVKKTNKKKTTKIHVMEYRYVRFVSKMNYIIQQLK